MREQPTVPNRVRKPPTARLPIPEVPGRTAPDPRGRPSPPPVRPPGLPLLLPLLGGLWWLVGSSALGVGVGTVVLALGLAATVWLVRTMRTRFGRGAPLPPGGRTRLTRVVGATAVLAIGASIGLGYLGYGELAVPLTCGIIGIALFSVTPLLDDRTLLALGSALLVVAATGAVLALDSAGTLYPQGLVGLVAGTLTWLAAAHRGGLLVEWLGRVREQR